LTSYDHTNPAEYGTDAHQKEIAAEAARETVAQLFAQLGYDTSDVTSMRELQGDLRWVRDARQRGEQVGEWARKATIWSLVGAVLVVLWIGIKAKIGGGS